MATRKLAEFVNGTSYEDIPFEVREHGKLVFLDWLRGNLSRIKGRDCFRYDEND